MGRRIFKFLAQKRTELFWLSVLTVCTLPLLAALLPSGYFYTHDSSFHLIRAVHYYQQLQLRQFPVRHVPSMAFGYGYPTFNFFYPLPYALTSLLHVLGVNFGDSLKLLTLACTLSSIWVMYAWLRCHFTRVASVWGSLIYMFVPYRLLTLYVTGQIGALFSFVWMPLILWSLYALLIKKNLWAQVVLSVAIAGFISSHLLSVIAFIPVAVGYGALLLFQNSSTLVQIKKSFLPVAIAVLLGGLLSATYWMPAIGERHLIKAGHELTVQYADHFPTLEQLLYSPWGYSYSGTGPVDGMSFQIGIGQILVIGVALSVLMLSLIQRTKSLSTLNTRVAIGMALFSLGTIFFMLDLSGWIWDHSFVLPLLQYPWRLLALMMIFSSYLAAWIAAHSKLQFLLIPIALLCVFNVRNYRQPMSPERHPDSYYMNDARLFEGSSDISWELLPANVDMPPSTTAESLVRNPNIQIPVTASAEHEFRLRLEQPQEIVFNLFSYPSWKVTANGKNLTTMTSDQGLLKVSLPSGDHVLKLQSRQSTLQHFSNWISLLSLPLIAGSILWQYRDKKSKSS